MSANHFFIQCLADFTGLRVAVSSEREATTRGAGLMALVGVGATQPRGRRGPLVALGRTHAVPRCTDAVAVRRDEWARVVARVEKTIPELSAVEF